MDDRLFSGGIYPDRPSLFSCRTGCAGAHSVNEWSDRISSTGMHRLLMPDIYQNAAAPSRNEYFRTTREK